MMMLTSRFFLTFVIATSALVSGQTGQETSAPSGFGDDEETAGVPLLMAFSTQDDGVQPATLGAEQCPLVMRCCEEDCCGEGTSWQSRFCILDSNSSGFNGTYSSAWQEGCIPRVCCENECCSPETEYNTDNAVCVPKGNSQKVAAQMPIRPPEGDARPIDSPILPPDLPDGLGATDIDGECSSNGDCNTGYCYLALGSPGTCSCSPDTNLGCSKGYECAGSGKLFEVQGLVFIAEPRPECLLIPGMACTPGESKCVTGLCDKKTLTCACNSQTNYPCNTKSGETCSFIDDSYVCSGGQVGEGKIGDACFNNQDCDTGWCEMGWYVMEGSPGYCSCNPKTNIGCEGDFVCVSGGDLMNAQFIADAGPGCYLPHGATCDPMEKGCLSMNCDKTTRQCACSTYTNYPCKTENGEVCVLDEKDNTYVCQLGSSLSIPDCPKPSDGIVCTAEYAPVLCNGCEYSNQCLASAAGFTVDTCEPILIPIEPPPLCPVPDPGISCTKEYRPVVCGDCEYDNQCLATAANADYTSDTCKPKPSCPVGNGICPEIYEPVDCGGCQYSNQCFATSADATFTAETCVRSPVLDEPLPPDYGRPPPEYVPVEPTGGAMQAPKLAGAQQAPEYTYDMLPLPPEDVSCVLTGEGPFEMGQPCIEDGNCTSGYCFYGFQIAGSCGTCSCNPETDAGCPSGFGCASSNDLIVAQRIADAPPGCFLPDGADCDPAEYNCLSGTCDEKTHKCACNTFSNYPCADKGLVCVINGDNIHVCE